MPFGGKEKEICHNRRRRPLLSSSGTESRFCALFLGVVDAMRQGWPVLRHEQVGLKEGNGSLSGIGIISTGKAMSSARIDHLFCSITETMR